jgi:hypothetical protein
VSRLLDARAELVAALEAAGLAAATGPRFAAPCVLVEPGEPWSSPAAMPGRSSHWKLTLVAGRSDSEAALEVLAELVDRVDTALRTIAGVQLPTWGHPDDITLEGVPYGVTVATVLVGWKG